EDELGQVDILAVHSWLESSAPFDQLSADEWQPVLDSNMTVPFVAMQAFAKLMERRGGGVIAVAAPRREAADAAEQAAAAGLARLLEVAGETWSPRGIHTLAFDPYTEDAESLLARLAGMALSGGSSEA